MASDTIIGRTDELDVIASFLAASHTGARGLLIEEEAGIEKTTTSRSMLMQSTSEGGRGVAAVPSRRLRARWPDP